MTERDEREGRDRRDTKFEVPNTSAVSLQTVSPVPLFSQAWRVSYEERS
jgi:hypothetical protein